MCRNKNLIQQQNKKQQNYQKEKAKGIQPTLTYTIQKDNNFHNK